MAPRLTTLKSKLQKLPGRMVTVSADSWRSDKQSSTARGYGYAWQKARAGYLAKHPYCAYCLRDAGVSYDQDAADIELAYLTMRVDLPRATVVDHIEPHRGDWALFWDSSRWQSLCKTHHSRDKQREEAAGRTIEKAPSFTIDGADLIREVRYL